MDEDSCSSQREKAKEYLELGSATMWTSASLCRQLGERSFDYIRVECLRELLFISRLKEELKRYSLVIVGLGIHDVVKPDRCALPEKGGSRFNANMMEEGRYKHFNQSFDIAWKGTLRIAKILQQTKRQDNPITTAVLWRTSGFHSTDDASVTNTILHMNRLSWDRFRNRSMHAQSENGTVVMVDWGSAIFPRSFLPDRIEGDIRAHYGLEARLLMAQMTTQQVMNLLHHSHCLRSTAHGAQCST